MNHRNRTIAILASLTLVGTTYGCSSSSSSGDDSSANPDGGTGTGTGDGGGTGTDGGGGGGGQEYEGAITVADSLAVGVFLKKTTASNSCVTTSGNCKFYNCPTDSAGVPAYSAGDITVTGGKLASPLVLSFEADSGTYSTTYSTSPFAPGDKLGVSAAGGDVTAFSGTTGAAPSAITLTAPTGTGTPDFQSYAIDTSHDLNVTWTGGTAGTQVDVALSNDDDTSRHLELQCSFDAAAGTGTITTAALAQLGAPSTGVFEVTPISVATTSSSNASVTLQLTTAGVSGTWSKQ